MAIFTLILVVTSLLSQSVRIEPSDFHRLIGDRWTGELTYLDYGSKKEVVIRSNLSVTREDSDSWTFEYEYPDEPKANSKKTLSIVGDGTRIDDETIIERNVLPDGMVQILSERAGKDDNREAVFRYTYLISEKSFSIKKEVRLAGSSEWFERNRYRWAR